MNRTDPLAAIVWNAQQLSEAFNEVKALEFQAEANGREMLRNFRDIGNKLGAIRKRVPRGDWLKVLEQHMPGRRRLAYKCIAIAGNWEAVRKAAGVKEALEIIADLEGREQEVEDAEVAPGQIPPSPQVPSGQGQPERSNVNSSGKKTPSGGSGRGRGRPKGRRIAFRPKPKEEGEEPAPVDPLGRLEAAMRTLVRLRELLSVAVLDEKGKEALTGTLAGREPRLKLLVDGGSIVVPGANGEEKRVNRLSNGAIDDLFRLVGQAQMALAQKK